MSHYDYHHELILTSQSPLDFIKEWDIYKEQHYVKTSDEFLVPLPTVYSLVATLVHSDDLFWGLSEPYYNHSIDAMKKFAGQVEEYFSVHSNRIALPESMVEEVEHYYGRIM